MKKIVFIVLVLVFALTLCACGKEESKVSCFDEQPVPKPQGISFEEMLPDKDGSQSTYYYYFESDDTMNEAKEFYAKYIVSIEKQGFTSEEISWLCTRSTLIYKGSEPIAMINLYDGNPHMLSVTFDSDPSYFEMMLLFN